MYETFCAVPVTLVRKGGLFSYSNKTKKLFVGEWQLVPPNDMYEGDPGYAEEYDASRRELYRTQRRAQRVADRLNDKMQARREKGEL
jgi:hypothetical protein